MKVDNCLIQKKQTEPDLCVRLIILIALNVLSCIYRFTSTFDNNQSQLTNN